MVSCSKTVHLLPLLALLFKLLTDARDATSVIAHAYMVGRLITSAICCLSAGSMKGLSQSLGLTSVVRASAAPALGRVSTSRSCFSIGRRPIVQGGMHHFAVTYIGTHSRKNSVV